MAVVAAAGLINFVLALAALVCLFQQHPDFRRICRVVAYDIVEHRCF